MHTTRFFRLSNTVLASLEQLDKNRSRVITAALKEVYDDPEVIVRELQERLNENGLTVSAEQSRAAVYLPGFVAGGLDDLVTKLRLPVEDVGRLAIEAYIRKHSKSQKAPHEPARPVQHASEGRNLD